MTFIKDNQKDRIQFVDKWAEYVRTHNDREWSKQQNVIINSCLRTAFMTKEQFFKMKGEEKYLKS